MWHNPWLILISLLFLPEISKFVLTFIESTKVALVNMISIFTMSTKLATQSLVKIKWFGNEGYEIIIFVFDVTNKILSHESNVAVLLVI